MPIFKLNTQINGLILTSFGERDEAAAEAACVKKPAAATVYKKGIISVCIYIYTRTSGIIISSIRDKDKGGENAHK